MNELYHHGIKGQKWGVRRYQNPDGTLTEAGKSRYEVVTSKSKEAYQKVKDAKKEYKQAKKEASIFKSKQAYKEVKKAKQSYKQAKRDALKTNIALNYVMPQAQMAQNNFQIQQLLNQQAMQTSMQEANRAASLAMTGGMNPFMFG